MMLSPYIQTELVAVLRKQATLINRIADNIADDAYFVEDSTVATLSTVLIGNGLELMVSSFGNEDDNGNS